MALNFDTKPKNAEPVEMITLFTLDEQDYDIPAKAKVVTALRYLNNVRKHGEDMAAAALMEDLLGANGWEALLSYEDLAAEDLQTILELAGKHVLGALDGRGKSS